MFPLVLFGALAGLLAWAVRPKTTGVAPSSSSGMGKFIEAPVPEGFIGPPLQPEEEALLSLLTMWVKDKRFPVGQKRYFSRKLAQETAERAAKLGLVRTAQAVLTDGPIPNEGMGRRGVTVKEAIVVYNRSKK